MRRSLTLLFITLLAFDQLSAQEDDRSTKGELAVQIGMGLAYGGGLGVSVEYQIPYSDFFRFTPYLGAGIQMGGTDTSATSHLWFGSVLGINAEYGKRHRIICGPQFLVYRNIHSYSDNGSAVESLFWRTLVGVSFIIGYKGVASSGCIWQISLGAACVQDPYRERAVFSINPHFGLGLGYSL
jgi:hypothetical protein